jgi:hypothetical protein
MTSRTLRPGDLARASAGALLTALGALAVLALLVVFLLATSAMVGSAFAQTVADVAAGQTTVDVPYGKLVMDGTDILLGAISIAVAAAFRFLPPHIRWALQLARAEQLFDKALAKLRAEINEDFATKTWSVDARNEALAVALRYCIDHYPALVEKLGGRDLVRDKLAARLQELIERTARR